MSKVQVTSELLYNLADIAVKQAGEHGAEGVSALYEASLVDQWRAFIKNKWMKEEDL
jgi:hypothetical protein